MDKALDAEERLHVCFKMIASMMSAKQFKCDLFHFRDLFKIRYNSLRCLIVFVVSTQLLWHYFNELSIFVVYRANHYKTNTNQSMNYFQFFLNPVWIIKYFDYIFFNRFIPEMDLFCGEMFVFTAKFVLFKQRQFMLVFLIENGKMLVACFKLLNFGI